MLGNSQHLESIKCSLVEVFDNFVFYEILYIKKSEFAKFLKVSTKRLKKYKGIK